MTMAHGGLAKMAEEAGEVLQVVGKLLAYPFGDHPDGGGDLLTRLEDEIADLQAACEFVKMTHKLDSERIHKRTATKLTQFVKWHEDPST